MYLPFARAGVSDVSSADDYKGSPFSHFDLKDPSLERTKDNIICNLTNVETEIQRLNNLSKITT